ncbi:MAG: substrate-binding domain-containing protein [Solirubrobacteraceae bacterium]
MAWTGLAPINSTKLIYFVYFVCHAQDDPTRPEPPRPCHRRRPRRLRRHRESGAGGGGGSNSLSLVAYSTPKEAYEEIIPAFRKTSAGSGVEFTQSYGNSGDQARAAIAGLPTDVAALSLEPDVTKLVKENLVASDWSATPTKGIVTRSVVALAVRRGNPKNIEGWADLVRPGAGAGAARRSCRRSSTCRSRSRRSSSASR